MKYPSWPELGRKHAKLGMNPVVGAPLEYYEAYYAEAYEGYGGAIVEVDSDGETIFRTFICDSDNCSHVQSDFFQCEACGHISTKNYVPPEINFDELLNFD